MKNKPRSTKFLFNARHSTEDGARKIEAARHVARSANAQARETGSPVRLRVVLSVRGKDPRHAWKYENKHMKGLKRWRIEDATSVDVYLLRTGDQA